MESKNINSINDKETHTPRKSYPNTDTKRTISSSNKRFSDRFIPNSINKSLINEFSISCGALDTSTLSNNKESGRSRKSDAIYNKILESELINDQTPSKNNF